MTEAVEFTSPETGCVPDMDKLNDASLRQAEPVFVFGSNLAGRHGKGAALWARHHAGAIYGQGVGFQGNSYAIPTKDAKLSTLPLALIRDYVDGFLSFAASQPDIRFRLTPIGCGLAGYTREQIEPLFASAPDNVIWPPEWSGVRTPSTAGISDPSSEIDHENNLSPCKGDTL